MALLGTTVWEVESGGSDTNGGGFDSSSAGTDYSQKTSKNTTGSNKSTTDLTTTTSSPFTCTSATAAFTTAITGNIIYLSGGTGGTVTAGWYKATYASATTIHLDRTPGAVVTLATMNIGGALASPGQAGANMTVSGMICYVQNVGVDGNTVYTTSSLTSNVSGGSVTITSTDLMIQGYTTNRTLCNSDPRPTFQSGISGTTTMMTCTTYGLISGIILDGNSETSVVAFGGGTFYNCMFKNFKTATGATSTLLLYCSATTNSATIFTGNLMCVNCEAYANTATPFSLEGSVSSFIDCISYGNTGATTDGFISTISGSFQNCVSVSNGRDGFRCVGTPSFNLTNCIAESNTEYGFYVTGITKFLFNCSGYSNTNVLTSAINIGYIPITAGSVFVAPASYNFALNNTINQGALLRAAGFPAVFPRGDTSTYVDIGAAQHQGTSGTQSSYSHVS